MLIGTVLRNLSRVTWGWAHTPYRPRIDELKPYEPSLLLGQTPESRARRRPDAREMEGRFNVNFIPRGI